MKGPLDEPVLFLNTLLQDGCLDYGIIVFEICDILHHQDCFGFYKAEQTNDTIKFLLSDLSKEFEGKSFQHRRFQFLAICSKVRNARQFADTALRKVKALKIPAVDEKYLEAYPVAPNKDLFLTASALLLDRRVSSSRNEGFLENACAVHEIASMHRRGLVTTLDLTINEENT